MKRFYFILLLLTCFSSAMLAQLNGSGFYRLRSGSATDKYMSIVNDTISAQKIVGSLSSLKSDDGRKAAMNRVQPFLQTDIKLVNQNSVFTDPGTVIYLEKQSGSDSNYDFLSQGVGLKYISTCVFAGTNAHAWGLKGMPATINSVGNNLYTAYVNLSLSYPSFFPIYSIDETRFLGAESGKVVMTSVDNSNNYLKAPATCHWYIEPLNLTDNYFAAAPVSSFTQNGKYYTTLRTAFSYKVPSGSDVKVYKVTGMPTVDGELAETEEVSQGTIIPAGLPIIIESTSLEPANNKLEPYFNSSTAPIVKSTANYSPTNLLMGTVSSASISVTGCANSDVLYSGYGRHGHDAYSDPNHNSNSQTGYGSNLWSGWGPEGDNIGFFKNFVRYYAPATGWTVGTPSFYKLGIKDGAVGFWDLVQPKEVISGNEAYSPVQCQLFPVEKELVDIAEDGKEGISYDVIDNHLFGVKVVNGKLYAKDYGKFRYPDNNTNDAIDGMGKFYGYNEDYDQSNWVALDVANASIYVNNDLHVIGKLVNRQNPEIKVAKIDKTAPQPQVSSYQPNTYSPASFMGTQTSTVNGKTYFFVKPKPQELVHISWAIYGGDNKFYVNKPGNGINDAQIKGGFVASGDMLPQGASMSDFEVGKAYEFDAVVRVNEVSAGPSLLDEPYTDGGVSNIYTVYPYANISDTPTGVERLESGAQVVSVKYYNMMGVESDVPFKGINIMVTNYDNGISTRSKILK